jgi:hypothetical protein
MPSSSIVPFSAPPPSTPLTEPQIAKLLRAVARVMESGHPECIRNATDYLNLCVELATTASDAAIH